jgi:hypothetical protein
MRPFRDAPPIIRGYSYWKHPPANRCVCRPRKRKQVGRRVDPVLGSLSAAVPPGLSGDASFTITLWMKAGLENGRSNILDFGLQWKFAGMHLLLRADSIAQFGAFDSAGSGKTYSGLLDEVRFHASVLPPARLRLEYETQKP